MFNCNVNVDLPSDHPILSNDPYQFNDEEEWGKADDGIMQCDKADDVATRGKIATTDEIFDFADSRCFMA